VRDVVRSTVLQALRTTIVPETTVTKARSERQRLKCRPAGSDRWAERGENLRTAPLLGFDPSPAMKSRTAKL